MAQKATARAEHRPGPVVLCAVITVVGMLLLAAVPAAAAPQPRIYTTEPGQSLTAARAGPRHVGPSDYEITMGSFLAAAKPELAGVPPLVLCAACA